MASLSLLSFFVSFLIFLSPTHCTNSEGNALFDLRSKLKDPNDVFLTWDPTLVNPCTWYHVICDSNYHVIVLLLNNANISGSLGPELGQLKHLEYLWLSGNEISGPIPKELGDLEHLIGLDLYDNKFEGEIPKSLAKLKSLRFLRLDDNKLNGSIPREFTSLNELKVFNVSNNDIYGTIPPVNNPYSTFPMESSTGMKKNQGTARTIYFVQHVITMIAWTCSIWLWMLIIVCLI